MASTTQLCTTPTSSSVRLRLTPRLTPPSSTTTMATATPLTLVSMDTTTQLSRPLLPRLLSPLLPRLSSRPPLSTTPTSSSVRLRPRLTPLSSTTTTTTPPLTPPASTTLTTQSMATTTTATTICTKCSFIPKNTKCVLLNDLSRRHKQKQKFTKKLPRHVFNILL